MVGYTYIIMQAYLSLCQYFIIVLLQLPDVTEDERKKKRKESNSHSDIIVQRICQLQQQAINVIISK